MMEKLIAWLEREIEAGQQVEDYKDAKNEPDKIPVLIANTQNRTLKDLLQRIKSGEFD